MAELHEALQALSPIAWSDIPQDSLADFLSESFAAGELICNSLPAAPNGTPFEDSTPHYSEPNQANSSSEIHASDARAYPVHESHEALQKGWGKPVSVKARDNPLNASIYKVAGKDRHGAWFGRKSVHEGLGFDKFKRAMQREFPQSLTVTGGAGAGAVRGLAADRRLEKLAVEGTGNLDVYELSAQFPGPVTPRDFLTAVMTTEDALSEKSAAQTQGRGKHVPRHFMIVSRPLEHPDAPERAGFVRGQYESVEMIREIPLHANKPSTGGSGQDGGEATEEPPEAELNPVEWVMVTRSDPGGGIPRFLVDRGTPEAMLGDLKKFFDWACSMDKVPAPDADMDKQEGASAEQGALKDGAVDGTAAGTAPSTTTQNGTAATAPGTAEQKGGILSSIGSTLHAGLEAYAPTAVTNQVNHYLSTDAKDGALDSSDSDDTSDADSFMSANELHRLATAPEELKPKSSESLDTLSLASNSSEMKDKKDMNSHEKEVLKLVQKRESLDRKLARKRADEEAKLQKSKEKDQVDVEKAQERLEREMRRTEEKHRKELARLEQKREKEVRKAAEKRRKKDDANTLSRVSRERDDFRAHADLVRRENALLSAQVQDLQAEVMLLSQRLTKLGGPEALRGVAEELEEAGRARGASIVSVHSGDKVAATT
nr:reticulocyte-binding protein 2 like a [Quercus suber]